MDQSKGTHESGDSPILPFPRVPSSYDLLGQIGAGLNGVVHKATCLPLGSSVVAIKSINRTPDNIHHVHIGGKSRSRLSHPNILTAHCSFTVNSYFWFVMPFMSGGSLHSIMASSFPSGLPEPAIAVILKETLQALHYLHSRGRLHRNIKASKILINSDGSVKLVDVGVSPSIYKPSCSSTFSWSYLSSDHTRTPYSMAPEVIQSDYDYGIEEDIWSLGITAMELAHGQRVPLLHFWLNSEKGLGDLLVKFSKQFQDLVASCLVRDLSKRSTAEALLKHPFFNNCESQDYLVRHVLQGLPSVEEQFKLAAQVGKAGEAEEILVLTKNRWISEWKFNEEVELDPVFPDQEGGKAYSPFEADPSLSSTQSLSYASSVGEKDEMGNTEDTFDGEPLPRPPFQIDELSIRAQEGPSVSDQTCMERLVPGQVSLMGSLNEQERVKMALATCGIEVESLDVEYIDDVEARLVEVVNSLTAKVERLNADLEEEKKINFALMEENVQLKKKFISYPLI